MDINERTYLIPANSKKAILIFGFMTMTDLIIAIVGVFVSFLLLIALPVNNLGWAILALVPAFIAAFLVFPIANYHNSRILLQEIYRFYFKDRRIYKWRGWCYQYEQSDE